MGVYHCGVEGPLSLEDGRIVTSHDSFELEVDSPHDQHLVDSGQIVLVEEDPTEEQPADSAATQKSQAAPAAAQKPAQAAQAAIGEAK
jgi:hypothetical protein